MAEYARLTPQDRLDAICWAAKKAGQSYGKFAATLTQNDKEAIYERYQSLLEKKAAAERKRLEAKRSERAAEEPTVRKAKKRVS